MSAAFDRAVRFVLDREGGSTITDDPNDRGGVTKYGISTTAYPDADIPNLTEAAAIAIYRSDYWDACRCSELPRALACLVFDVAVNQSPGTAAKLLQQALAVTDDGVIGPATLQAAACADVGESAAEFTSRRLVVYGLNPQFTRYGLGWVRRAIACYRMATTQ